MASGNLYNENLEPEHEDPRDLRDAAHFCLGLVVWIAVVAIAWWIS